MGVPGSAAVGDQAVPLVLGVGGNRVVEPGCEPVPDLMTGIPVLLG